MESVFGPDAVRCKDLHIRRPQAQGCGTQRWHLVADHTAAQHDRLPTHGRLARTPPQAALDVSHAQPRQSLADRIDEDQAHHDPARASQSLPVGEPLLQIQAGRHAVEGETQLNHREGDVRLDPDHHDASAA